MKQLVLIVLAVMVSQILAAQLPESTGEIDSITVPTIIEEVQPIQDARLTQMVSWHIENNEKKRGMDGFRVEIFFSLENDAREKALEVKHDFLSRYPDSDVRIKYNSPYFKVRVGNFRTRNEALKLQKQLLNKYPIAFIVPDIIKFPELNMEGNN